MCKVQKQMIWIAKDSFLILTFIRAVVTEKGSCAPEIFYTDFNVFI